MRICCFASLKLLDMQPTFISGGQWGPRAPLTPSWICQSKAALTRLEIACEGAPAASAERGSCGEPMELSSGVTTGIAIDARRTTHGGRGSADEGGLWVVVAGDRGWLRRVLDLY